MSAILPSKAHGSHAYHPLLQHGPNSEAGASATSHTFSFQEVDALEQSQVLESLKSGASKTSDKDSDTMMILSSSSFDSASQPTFVPSTPGASSTMLISVSGVSPKGKGKGKGKRKDDHNNNNNSQMLIHPKFLQAGIKSARISMPEAVQQVGSEIQGLSKGLTMCFDRATTTLEERTASRTPWI
ncbi:hypothetical protein DEU56DRAFT_753966 [Suillus clintonianus]|uniref:uncharacterized protein n=1 Tax=Suillus clintonianus TaxID=1904413 RepID=UPI001B873D95|nr:uncharacterized protein DEU56DRAFT_753966 [Suillus clintonianus]KAG2145911.1 hypothetical protein DEU56DRAFT_753966 [Suillus clintonianus]